MKSILIYICTISLLGLFAGGSITILFIIIPFWYTLQPNDLMQWFTNFGARVGITMLPMQIIPLLLSIYAYIIAKKGKEDGGKLWLLVNVSNVIILIMLFVYFLPVNLLFVNQTMNPNDVSSELIRWELIHIARTILAVLSVVLAIVACSKHIKYSIIINIKGSR